MLLIIDLEATCWDRIENRQREDMEVIEIGGALLMDGQIKPESRDDYIPTFSIFVKPKKNPILSDFCKNLTSIKQEDVDGANLFPEALGSFLLNVGVYLGAESISNIIWGSWGRYDHNQVSQDCALHGLKYPFGKHWNIKRAYSESRGVKKGFGLAKALKQLDLRFEGTHHRGIDDAIMISKVTRQVLGESYMRFKNDHSL